MAYPALIFADTPPELAGKIISIPQVLGRTIGYGGTIQVMRQKIGMLQEWGVSAIRDNEMDGAADYAANLAAAQTLSTSYRAHLGTLIRELTKAGIYYMPTWFYDQWGLDQDATVRAAMPVGYPMQGATSLYNSFGHGAGVGWTATAKTAVRHFLIALWLYGDGGTLTYGTAGAKPGANRTTALGLGGDALIDAIGTFMLADTAAFATVLGWGSVDGLKLWSQMGNGPENPSELTMETFMASGYFGNSLRDTKQQAANDVGRLCGVHFPHFGLTNSNPEASAAARDTLYHERRQWGCKILSDLLYGDQAAANLILEQSVHMYWQGSASDQPRCVGNFQKVGGSKIITETMISRKWNNEPRILNSPPGTNPRRNSTNVGDDADEVVTISVPLGVALKISSNGGETIETVVANATDAQVLAAVMNLPGVGDTGEWGSDVAVDWISAAAREYWTQKIDAAGVQMYQYRIRMGGVNGPDLADNSKSKMKKGPLITVHNPAVDGVYVWRWRRGGQVDRGPAIRAWIKFLVEEWGFEAIGLHMLSDSRGPATTMQDWTVAADGSFGYNKYLLDNGRAIDEFIGFAFLNDEPESAKVMQWIGRYFASLNT